MNTIDSIMKDKLYDAESPVSDSVWQRVEVGLSKENNGRVLGLFWMVSLAVILIISLGSIYFFSGSSTSSTTPTVKEEVLPTSTANNGKIITTESFMTSTKSVDVKDSTFIKNMKAIKEANR